MTKFKKIETLRPHTHGRCYTCFLYVAKGHSHGDSVFAGSEDGRVSVYNLQENSAHITNVKEEELAKESKTDVHHRAHVQCLLHSSNSKLTGQSTDRPDSYGLLFSGSRDGTVKVWSSTGDNIQTLPHSSSVTALADGCDGTILSVCSDGYLRMWAPQAGRTMMLNPFYECTFNVSVLHPGDNWLSAIAVDTFGRWGCFLGEGDGSISIFKKPRVNLNDTDEAITASQSVLRRQDRWEKVHELGVTNLYVIPENAFLVSLSADASCKVVDNKTGATIYSMQNRQKCIFTGMILVKNNTFMQLSDELGGLHTFSFAQEKIIHSETLVTPNRTRKDRIMATHLYPVLGGMQSFRSSSHGGEVEPFLLFMKPPPKRGLSSADAPDLHTGSHAHDVYTSGGEIALWMPSDGEEAVVQFVGHQGPVVGLGVYVLNNSFNNPLTLAQVEQSRLREVGAGNRKGGRSKEAAQVKEVVFQVSKEEASFFSCASDKTIRCWDEFDGREMYQFKTKSRADIICMCMLWGMNSLATGHENGMITLWNADAGTFVTSHVLQSSLTAIVEARNSHSHLLVGADFSGRLAVWNLTLFKMNPISLPLEMHEKSRHTQDEPGILCLAVHAATSTFFSGGMDSRIIAWRLEVMTFYRLEACHTEAVCALECSQNFLLSGDEHGEVVLWVIGVQAEPTFDNMNPFPPVIALCKWFSFNKDMSFRSIVSLREIDPTRVFVLQADEGPTRTSVLWKVRLQDFATMAAMVTTSALAVTTTVEKEHEHYKEGVSNSAEETKSNKERDPLAESAPTIFSQQSRETTKMDFIPNATTFAVAAAVVTESSSSAQSKFHPSAPIRKVKESLEYDIYPKGRPDNFKDIAVTVTEAHTMSHEEDLSCARILGSSTEGPQCALRALYFGSMVGPIIRVPIHIDATFEED